MLKIQMALISLLIGCLTFTSCELGQELVRDLVTPGDVPEETVPEETVPEETVMATSTATEGTMPDYTSWLSVNGSGFSSARFG